MTVRDTQRAINRLVRPRRQDLTLGTTPTKAAIPARTGIATPTDARQATGGGGLHSPFTANLVKYKPVTIVGTTCEIDDERDIIIFGTDRYGVPVTWIIPDNVTREPI